MTFTTCTTFVTRKRCLKIFWKKLSWVAKARLRSLLKDNYLSLFMSQVLRRVPAVLWTHWGLPGTFRTCREQWGRLCLSLPQVTEGWGCLVSIEEHKLFHEEGTGPADRASLWRWLKCWLYFYFWQHWNEEHTFSKDPGFLFSLRKQGMPNSWVWGGGVTEAGGRLHWWTLGLWYLRVARLSLHECWASFPYGAKNAADRVAGPGHAASERAGVRRSGAARRGAQRAR